MRTHPPSQLALFDAPGPERPEKAPRSEPAAGASAPASPPRRSIHARTPDRSEADPQLPLYAGPALDPRLPAREEAVPLASELARRLSSELGAPVHLRLTDNRATLVSFRRGPEGLRLRAHHLFLGAPDAVVRAMADYAGRGRESAREVLEDYARQRQGLVRRERLPGTLRTRGRCFDLQAVASRLSATYFGGRVRVETGWARRPSGRRRSSIHLGGYDVRLREIRIHPALDKPHVPAFVVDYLVFHAMLHADLAVQDAEGTGRCAPEHTPDFEAREAAFPLREAAQRWLADNLNALKRG